jgi:hypothetical protein
MAERLQIVLGVDNDARKAAEEELKKIREGDPSKYAGYLSYIIGDAGAPPEVVALGAVILRRNLNTSVKDDKTLWELIDEAPREFMKNKLLAVVQTLQTKDLIHKVCDCLVEIAGAMYEMDSTTWKELFALIF